MFEEFTTNFKKYTDEKVYTFIPSAEKYDSIFKAIKNTGSLRNENERNWRARYNIRQLPNGEEKLYKNDKEMLKKEDVFYLLDSTHARLGHAGRDLMYKNLSNYWGLSKEIISIYLNTCKDCFLKKAKFRKSAIVKPIVVVEQINNNNNNNNYNFNQIMEGEKKFQCNLCNLKEFRNIHELEAHISADHFNCLPYWCDSCKYTRLPTEYTLKEHCESVHGLSEYNIHYRYSKELGEIQTEIAKLLQKAIENMALKSPLTFSDLEPISPHTTISIKKEPIDSINDGNEQQINETKKTILPTQIISYSSKKLRNSTNGPLAGISTIIEDVVNNNEQQLYSKFILIVFKGVVSETVKNSSALLLDGDNACTSSALMPLLNQCSQMLDEKRFDKSATESSFSGLDESLKLEINEEDMEFQDSTFNNNNNNNNNNNDDEEEEEEDSDHSKINDSLLLNGIINSQPAKQKINRRRNIQKGNHYSCLKCESVVSGPCIIKHINYKHTKLPFYRCLACGKTSQHTSRTAITQHINLVHGGDMRFLENNYKECASQVRQVRAQYFSVYQNVEDSKTALSKLSLRI